MLLLQIWFQPQSFAKVDHGLVWLPLVQQSPALIGVSRRVVRIVSQRLCDRGPGILAATELHQRHRLEVRASHVVRIAFQSTDGRVQTVLPAIPRVFDAGE